MHITNTNSFNTNTPISDDTTYVGMEIELHTGDKLPVKLLLDGEVFNSSELTHTVELGKTILMKMEGHNEPLFRLGNSDSWHNFEQLFTGRLDASVSITDASPEPSGDLKLLLNIRK